MSGHFTIDPPQVVHGRSPVEDKIALFRSLFRGREDVYPRRFENLKTGRSGYAPACGNEWVRGICEKPRIKCADCPHRAFLPVTDPVIRMHLSGMDLHGRDFVAGIYPMLADETCYFLAMDFDKETWQEDVRAVMQTCQRLEIPAVLERSRSGNGGHVWLFFHEAVPATLARKLGSFILTETMECRPEIGLASYDRLFPNQDTLPKGGFGNLIALPLQKVPRDSGHSVFVDNELAPWPDQWAFLSSIRYRVDAKQQADARPFSHHVIVRPTGFRSLAEPDPDRRMEYQNLCAEIMRCERRNDMICNEVLAAVCEGRSPLVLTERTEHVACLSSMLSPHVPNLIILQGGMGRKSLRETMDQLAAVPENEARVVIATGKFVGEGFDDSRLDTLFLTMPVSSRGIIAQYAGRLHRLHEGKREVRIHDYADLDMPMLARMFDKRCAGYEAVGYTILLGLRRQRPPSHS